MDGSKSPPLPILSVMTWVGREQGAVCIFVRLMREINFSDQFVRLAVEALPELGPVVDEQVGERAPSLVPGTTLYAAIGARIAETDRGILERSGIFDLVERGMLSASEHVVTLVATGLIEGLIAASESLGTWQEIEPLLGTQSRSHANAWINFYMR